MAYPSEDMLKRGIAEMPALPLDTSWSPSLSAFYQRVSPRPLSLWERAGVRGA